MTGPAPEGVQRPEQREQFRPFLTPGVARFMAAAQENAASKRFFNPEPLHIQQPAEGIEVREALSKADSHYVDIHLVDMISTGIRHAASDQKEREGKGKDEQMKEWAEGMVSFLQILGRTATPELKELARKRFCIDLTQTDMAVLWDEAGTLWDKYLAGRSDIRRFFIDLLTGIHGSSPQDIREMQRRIGLIDPFLGMFGDDRVSLLVRDVGNATVLLGIDDAYKNDVVQVALESLQQDFSTDTQKAAYQLVWDLMKDQIPQKAQAVSPPQQAAPPQRVAQPAAATQPDVTPSLTPSLQPPTQPSVSTPPPAPPQQRKAESPPMQTVQQEQFPVEQRQAPAQAEPPEEPTQTQQPSVSSPPQIHPTPLQQQPRPPQATGAENAQQVSSQAPPPSALKEHRDETQPSYARVACVLARDPEKPWTTGDALLIKELSDGGFVLGAFDGIEKGGEYSAGIARKLKQIAAKTVGASGQMAPVDMTVREVISTFSQLQPFEDKVRQGAVQELTALNVDNTRKKEILENIGTTGLVAIAAKERDRPVLVGINLGNSRLLSYNPDTGAVTTLFEEQLRERDRLKRPPRLLRSENQKFLDAHKDILSAWVRGEDIAELEKKLQEQRHSGWSQKGDLLRVFPLQKQRLYLVLSNGITLNIPPAELSRVIDRAYMQSQKTQGNIDMNQLVRSIAREAQKRMKKPENYRLEVRGKEREYVVHDTSGIAGIWYT